MDWDDSPLEDPMYLSDSGFKVNQAHLLYFIAICLFTFYLTELEVEIKIPIDLKFVKAGVSR